MSAKVAAKTTSAEPVLLRQDADGIARLILNRPAQRNALTLELMAALQAEIDAIGGDDAIKVVVIA